MSNENTGTNSIIVQLDTKDVIESINKMVKSVNEATNTMAGSFTSLANQVKQALGDIGQSSDNLANKVKSSTDAQTESAKKVAQANKEVKTTYDDMANAMQKSTGRMSIMETYDMQIQILKSDLENAKLQVEQFRKVAQHAGETGDKGYFVSATSNLHHWEQEVTRLTNAIRTMEGTRGQLNNVMQSQGDSLKNYVNSLTHVSPELQKINESYKNGTRVLEDCRTSVVKLNEAEQQRGRTVQQVQEEHARGIQQQKQWQQELADQIQKTGQQAIRSTTEMQNAIRAALAQKLPANAFLDPEKFKKPSDMIKQLQQNMTDLRNAYYQLSKDDRQTLYGQSLKNALDDATKLYVAIKELAWANSEFAHTRNILLKGDDTSKVVQQYRELGVNIQRLKYEFSQLSEEEKKSARGQELQQKIQQQTEQLRQLEGQVQKASVALEKEKQAEEQSSQAKAKAAQETDKLNAKHKELEHTNNLLGRSFQYIKNRIAFYLTVSAMSNFVKQLADIRGQYEMTERSLQILTDSARKGTEIFNELSVMAMNSPFTTIELTDAARTLSALGFEADQLVGTVKRLGDISAAVGAPIDRIAYALGQVQTYGYLTSLQARTFMRMGIPLVKSLAEEYSKLEGNIVTTTDVMQRMKDKAVSYKDVLQVINRMTDEGGRFFDYQAKVSDTLRVQLSNLQLAWQNMLNDIGKSNQSLLASPIKLLKTLFANWQSIERVIKSVGLALIGVKFVQMITIWATTLNWATASTATFGKKITTTFTNIKNSIKTVFTSALGWVGIVLTAIFDLLGHANRVDEKNRQLNESIRNNAKETSNSLVEFLKSYRELEDEIYKRNDKGELIGYNDIDLTKARNAWGEIKTQIEQSTSTSQIYIDRLMQIDNISERVGKGLQLTHSIQEAIGALQELNDMAITVNQDTWLWGSFGEGLKSDLQDYMDALKDFQEKLKQGMADAADKAIFHDAINEFKDEVSTTASDIVEQLNLQFGKITFMGGNFNEDDFTSQLTQMMVYSDEVAKNIAESEKMTATQAFEFKRELNNQLYNHYMSVIMKMTQSTNEETRKQGLIMKRIFQDTWTNNRISYQYFVDWMKNSHYTMVQDMYREFTENGTKAFDMTTEAGKAKINEILELFKQNNISAYNDVVRIVNLANMLTISIPVILDFGGDSGDVLEDQRKNNAKLKKVNEDLKDTERGLAEARRRNDAAEIKRWEDKKKYLLKQKELLDKIAWDEQKEKADQIARDKANRLAQKNARQAAAERRRQAAAAARAQHHAETELAKTLKEEISLIETLRQEYDKLRSKGIPIKNIKETLEKEFGESFKKVNQTLNKYGLELDSIGVDKFFTKDGLIDYSSLYNFFNRQLDKLKKSNKAIPEDFKEVEKEMLKLITSSMAEVAENISSSLERKLKMDSEQYEFYIAYDEDPELMDNIAKLMGFEDASGFALQAPQTLNDYVKDINSEFQETLNLLNRLKADFSHINEATKLAELSFELPEATILSGGYMLPFEVDVRLEESVKNIGEFLGKDSPVYQAFKAKHEEIMKLYKDEFKNTKKLWDELIKKYGEFDDKLMQIKRDTAEEMRSVVMQYGTNDERIKAMDLARAIKISQDPEEINRLSDELGYLMTKVISKLPNNKKGKASVIAMSISNKSDERISKEYWENFKKSDEYVTIFEDMDRIGTLSLEHLLSEMDKVKDKIEDSPESVKAWMSAYKKIREELEGRSPFETMFKSFLTLWDSTKALKEAKKNIKDIKKEVEQLNTLFENDANKDLGYNNIEDFFTSTQAWIDSATESGMSAEAINQSLSNSFVTLGDETISILDLFTKYKQLLYKLRIAQGEYSDAQTNNRGNTKAFVNATKNAQTVLNNMASALENVGDMFGFADDSAQGMAINELANGFKQVAEALGLVITIAEIAETSLGWVAVIGMAIAGLIASLNFIANYNNAKIDKKIAQSERAVKRLENTLKNLEQQADDSYGALEVGARQAIIANKQLQLVETKRQLKLEQSRRKKDRDKEKIIDLQGQVIDLENELNNLSKEISNNLLGISDAGSFAEELVQSMIDAFRDGEDAMKVFSEKWDEMIDNMIMKFIVSSVMQKWWDNVLKGVENIEKSYTEDIAKEKADAQQKIDQIKGMSDKDIKRILTEQHFEGKDYSGMEWTKYYNNQISQQDIEDWKNTQIQAQNEVINGINERLDQASLDATQASIDYMIGQKSEGEKIAGLLYDKIQENFTFGENSDKELSALQQGIQGITEDTAGALEAYMNSVSQQVYLQSDLLTQIRDVLTMYDFELQNATNAQILLSLQQSYQVQMAIQMLLTGWSNPSGNAVRVEMIA